MDNNTIISTINGYLHDLTASTCKWLEMMLPTVGDDWWDTCVLSNLSDVQLNAIHSEGVTSLSQLDLSALLRIASKSWWSLMYQGNNYLPKAERYKFQNMISVRNRWAHIPSQFPEKSVILSDLEYIKDLSIYTGADVHHQNQIRKFAECIRDDKDLDKPITPTVETPRKKSGEIVMNSVVHLVSDPNSVGIVLNIENIGDDMKYTVWMNNHQVTLYQGQIALNDATEEEELADRKKLLSNITAFQIQNPSKGKLYSLNSAKIDFVPYQFRPALKMIKNEEPRLLIADSVGVGKTIEAGILLKEMEARRDMDTVIIICPKPLITERKWESEMKRFDENFVPVDGKTLRQILSDYDMDGEWPQNYKKCIIPYSILTEELLIGDGDGKKKRSNIACLAELDPEPIFDMVIVDEAHHIRNKDTQAYKCVEYFCKNSDAAVFLTATPIQMDNQDLFTLLHLLREDLVTDYSVFRNMSEPNKYINEAARIIRRADEHWQKEAMNYLTDMQVTDWGKNVISKNPVYGKVMDSLHEPDLAREDRVQLITAVESLNSFSSIINRTRRKDIQDFCVRGTSTVEVDFDFEQKQLYDCLLDFEAEALTLLHGSMCIKFMMTTLRRQAASCIFGLEGSIRDITNRRLFQMSDDFNDGEYTDDHYSEGDVAIIKQLAQNLLEMTRNLKKDKDPKFDALLDVVADKQKQENNKIILFSCFRHTLRYLSERLAKAGYRVAHIDGLTSDQDRRDLRSRFMMPRESRDAIDIMLFTEVGSEGLDYQFCDMIINYDLPWNPMRIEQRIGRIDRRGQKSPKVSIINIITKGTIDAEIYDRCLSRIGVFESNIGDCDSILGEISSDIQKIINDTKLTDEEKAYRIEKLTENSVRQMNELKILEEQEKSLIGFDLSGMIMNNEMRNADDIFISPPMLQLMIEEYLNEVIGAGRYISGEGVQKNLRLSNANRVILKDDFNKLSKNKHGAAETAWRNYLKDSEMDVSITFDSDYAAEHPKCLFITTTHPLVRQAAAHFKIPEIIEVGLVYDTNEYKPGIYPFAIYSWNYRGYRPESKLVPICMDEKIENQLFDILTVSENNEVKLADYKESFDKLDLENMSRWKSAKIQHAEDVEQTIIYKTESLKRSYENNRAWQLSQLNTTDNPKIVDMKKRALVKAEKTYKDKLEGFMAERDKADILTNCIVRGVIEIRRG